MFIVKFYKNLIFTSTLSTYSGVYEAKTLTEKGKRVKYYNKWYYY